MRQFIERQEKLEPKRMIFAIKEIEKIGFKTEKINENQINIIISSNSKIHFFPYSGWASGKSIKDCRGITNLISQLKKLKEVI